MTTASPPTHFQGACLCGAVRYHIDGPLRPVILCHCKQCQRSTGSYMAATAVWLKYFQITRDDGLHWYTSSPHGRRGFCRQCGSTLFWQGDDHSYIAIAAGSLDNDEGLTVAAHIFVADKGRYYDIYDGLPRFSQSGHGLKIPG